MTEAKPNTTSLSLKLELAPGSDTALLRVIAVLHRRCCRVTRADYMATAAGDRLELALEAPPAHAHRVPAWLSGLIDVTRVEADHREPLFARDSGLASGEQWKPPRKGCPGSHRDDPGPEANLAVPDEDLLIGIEPRYPTTNLSERWRRCRS